MHFFYATLVCESSDLLPLVAAVARLRLQCGAVAASGASLILQEADALACAVGAIVKELPQAVEVAVTGAPGEDASWGLGFALWFWHWIRVAGVGGGGKRNLLRLPTGDGFGGSFEEMNYLNAVTLKVTERIIASWTK